eukprot:TRINITY_DN261_c0_g1_i1.p1 TRINITY_DN261_c0_g1~~TRINITY_DN261_c0_g1_i1.p1  ORF type:complete len:1369 (+),score=112.09 TRINITY_DN261_c0_g1_i1:1521-5627(+)
MPRPPRDIFPLPNEVPRAAAGDSFDSRSLSRPVRRRLERRSHQEVAIGRCLDALNTVESGFQSCDRVCSGDFISAGQAAAVSHVASSVRAMGKPPAGMDPAGAFAELRGASVYEDPEAVVVSYDPDLLSLPQPGQVPVALAQLYGSGGVQFCDDFIANKVLAGDSAAAKLASAGVGRCYIDPALAGRRAYIDFVKKLVSRNMVDFALSVTEEVGFFCVKKKSGRQRLVVDARRSNCHFADAEPVSLATGDTLGRLDYADMDMYVGHVDIKDAFYHFELPLLLRQYFGMPSVAACDLGVRMVDGHPVCGRARVFPRLKVLPMGWSHALWWCQLLHRRIVDRVPELDGADFICDKKEMSDNPLKYTVYVDNFLVFGSDRKAVASAVRNVDAALVAAGLPTHEECEAAPYAEVLGWCVDGRRGELRPKPDRLWRLTLALDFVLQRRTIAAADVEKILGHCTFVALVRRESLAVFRAIYAFVSRHRADGPVRLWSSVRRELEAFRGLLPLLWVNLRAPWSSRVVCTDASPWGYGCVQMRADEGAVKTAGRCCDRWQFSRQQEHSFRGHALAAPVTEPSTTDMGWFDTVAKLLESREWNLVSSTPWSSYSNIVNAEGRGLVFGLKHALRRTAAFNRRLVHLSDSLTCVLAFSKGRSSSMSLCRSIRTCAALLLATNTRVCWRWLPSELNPADGPSRGRPWQLGIGPRADVAAEQAAQDKGQRSNRDPEAHYSHARAHCESAAPTKVGETLKKPSISNLGGRSNRAPEARSQPNQAGRSCPVDLAAKHEGGISPSSGGCPVGSGVDALHARANEGDSAETNVRRRGGGCGQGVGRSPRGDGRPQSSSTRCQAPEADDAAATRPGVRGEQLPGAVVRPKNNGREISSHLQRDQELVRGERARLRRLSFLRRQSRRLDGGDVLRGAQRVKGELRAGSGRILSSSVQREGRQQSSSYFTPGVERLAEAMSWAHQVASSSRSGEADLRAADSPLSEALPDDYDFGPGAGRPGALHSDLLPAAVRGPSTGSEACHGPSAWCRGGPHAVGDLAARAGGRDSLQDRRVQRDAAAGHRSSRRSSLVEAVDGRPKCRREALPCLHRGVEELCTACGGRCRTACYSCLVPVAAHRRQQRLRVGPAQLGRHQAARTLACRREPKTLRERRSPLRAAVKAATDGKTASCSSRGRTAQPADVTKRPVFVELCCNAAERLKAAVQRSGLVSEWLGLRDHDARLVGQRVAGRMANGAVACWHLRVPAGLRPDRDHPSGNIDGYAWMIRRLADAANSHHVPGVVVLHPRTWSEMTSAHATGLRVSHCHVVVKAPRRRRAVTVLTTAAVSQLLNLDKQMDMKRLNLLIGLALGNAVVAQRVLQLGSRLGRL